MKLILVIIFAMLSYAITVYISIYSKYHDRLEYKELVNNKYRLLKTSSSPKIIVIGGSNVGIGISCKTLHNKFKIPVINCGIQAGIGLKFMIESIKPYIKSGDIVVLSPEYEHFYGNLFYGDTALLETCFLFPEGLIRIDWLDYNQLKAIYSSNMLREVNLNVLQENPNPLNKTFNKYGDFITPSKAKQTMPLWYNKITSNDMNLAAIDSLIDFNKYIQSKNAKLIFSFPSITKQKLIDEQVLINNLSAKIKNILPNTFSSPNKYAYDESYFFDTVYHLNSNSREVRTLEVIKEITKIR